jgi:hypothetical protein
VRRRISIALVTLRGPGVYSGFVFKSAPTRGGTMENVYIHDTTVEDAYCVMQGNETWPAGGTVPATFGSRYLEPLYLPPILVMPANAADGYPIFRNFKFESITMKRVETAVFGVAGYTLAGGAVAAVWMWAVIARLNDRRAKRGPLF